MPRLKIWILLSMVCCGLLVGCAPALAVQAMPETEQALPHTPPRLSLLDGQVSFWRPGAEDWVEARINTALAAGDSLYVGSVGNLELQIGAKAFLRAGSDTQISIEHQDAGLLQLRMTMGLVALDLTVLDPGLALVLETPNAAFTIQHEGYYRIEINEARTTLVTRRGGQAAAVLANGETVPITTDEAVTVTGTTPHKVTATGAPPQDGWDGWNQARTAFHLNAESARYVAPGTYGMGDLDAHGAWRTVPTYGTVWMPRTVPPGWVPYSTGTWIRDPYFGWTWVDSAPWGWAPFHYGRWVFVNSVWCWAPGPIIARPVYAPALVAFYGQPGIRVSVALGGPLVGWVALGWGEPVIPWWGRPGFIHRPYWGGWAGPRVINNVAIGHTTVINVRNITTYRNSRVPNAIVVVNERHFGHGPVTRTRPARADAQRLRPVHTTPRVTPSPANFVPTAARGARPPEYRFQRPVVESRVRERLSTTTRPATGRVAPAAPLSPSRETLRPLEDRRRPTIQPLPQSPDDRAQAAGPGGPSERGSEARTPQVVEPQRPSRPIPRDAAPLPRAAPEDRPAQRPRNQGQGVTTTRPGQRTNPPAIDVQRRPVSPVTPGSPSVTAPEPQSARQPSDDTRPQVSAPSSVQPPPTTGGSNQRMRTQRRDPVPSAPDIRESPSQERVQTPAQTPRRESPAPRGVAPTPTGRSVGPQEPSSPRTGIRQGDTPSRGRDTLTRPSR